MYLFQIKCFKLVMKIELLRKCIENQQNNLKKKKEFVLPLIPSLIFSPNLSVYTMFPHWWTFFFIPFQVVGLVCMDMECGPKVVHSA